MKENVNQTLESLLENEEWYKERIEVLEWEIQCNEEENDAMREAIKLLEKKLKDYE